MVAAGVRVVDESSVDILVVATGALLESDVLNTFFVLERCLPERYYERMRVNVHVRPWFWARCH